MNNVREELKFDIFGHKVNLAPGSHGDEEIELAKQAIDIVQSESKKLMEQNPSLDIEKAAILVALKFAQERLSLSEEYRDNIEMLQNKAMKALKFIEETTATQI